jgi:hypothetical protein
LLSLIARQYNHVPKTRTVRGMVVTSRIHHWRETLKPSLSKSKKVVLRIAETNVPGRKNMVIAAMVIIDAESRCVCSATFEQVSKCWCNDASIRSEHTIAVDVAISVLVRASRWFARWKS